MYVTILPIHNRISYNLNWNRKEISLLYMWFIYLLNLMFGYFDGEVIETISQCLYNVILSAIPYVGHPT